MDIKRMFLKRITIALAILLTMFAVDAQAITCTPLPSECNGSTGSGSNSITIQFTGPGGTINCTYDFCYCYTCPDPILDPPNTPIKIIVWSIAATSGCPDADLSLVYEKIKEKMTSKVMVESMCGVIPPCEGQSPNYKDVSYEVSACWYAINKGGTVYFKPCPGCTSICITGYRYCILNGELIITGTSNTLVGSIDCGVNCLGNTNVTPWPYGDNEQSDCYHICQ
jgi:hypothetical protein